MLVPFLINFLIKTGIYFFIMYLSGLLVIKMGVRVNYTRKINHFSLLAVPFLMGLILGQSQSSGGGTSDYIMQAVGLLSGLLFFALFFKPVRERVSIFNTAFSGIDRPEDRPSAALRQSPHHRLPAERRQIFHTQDAAYQARPR